MTQITLLEDALAQNPADPRAAFELASLLYDHGRREEAITWWEKSAKLDGTNSAVWRYLGLAYYNVLHDKVAAEGAYKRAFRLTLTPPTEDQELDGTYTPMGGDARLLYERDQLAKHLQRLPKTRLQELNDYLYLIPQSDDLTLEFCSLLILTHQHARALEVLQTHTFQAAPIVPTRALDLWTRAHLALGRTDFWRADSAPQAARAHFQAALNPPANLAAPDQPRPNPSELHYWSGLAAKAAHDRDQARQHFQTAASSAAAHSCSADAFFAGMASHALDLLADAQARFDALLVFAHALKDAPAPAASSATPAALFDVGPEGLLHLQHRHAALLEALALYGLNSNRGADRRSAHRLLGDILIHDPNHVLASDLLSALDWNL